MMDFHAQEILWQAPTVRRFRIRLLLIPAIVKSFTYAEMEFNPREDRAHMEPSITRLPFRVTIRPKYLDGKYGLNSSVK